ncbi:hypothetical protein IU452_00115 [Nocardia transvalensis]|nr:hypothetical protein [Nocardia transvalensis]
MTTEGDVIDRLVAAVESVAGLRPAVPLALPDADWLPWDRRRAAIDLSPGSVEVQVVATALPLPPLLERLTELVRDIVTDTEWADAALRIVVTDLDADAFKDSNTGNSSVT